MVSSPRCTTFGSNCGRQLTAMTCPTSWETQRRPMPSPFPFRPGSRLVSQLVGHLEVGDAEQWDAVLAGGYDPVALSGHRDGVVLHVPSRGLLPAVHAPGRHEEREREAEDAEE